MWLDIFAMKHNKLYVILLYVNATHPYLEYKLCLLIYRLVVKYANYTNLHELPRVSFLSKIQTFPLFQAAHVALLLHAVFTNPYLTCSIDERNPN